MPIPHKTCLLPTAEARAGRRFGDCVDVLREGFAMAAIVALCILLADVVKRVVYKRIGFRGGHHGHGVLVYVIGSRPSQ